MRMILSHYVTVVGSTDMTSNIRSVDDVGRRLARPGSMFCVMFTGSRFTVKPQSSRKRTDRPPTITSKTTAYCRRCPTASEVAPSRNRQLINSISLPRLAFADDRPVVYLATVHADLSVRRAVRLRCSVRPIAILAAGPVLLIGSFLAAASSEGAPMSRLRFSCHLFKLFTSFGVVVAFSCFIATSFALQLSTAL